VNPNEIAIHKVKGNGVSVIVDLLGKAVGQASEAAHVHPHRKILAFNEGSAYMLGVWVSTDDFHIAADADCRRISRLRFSGGTKNLLQLCIIAVHSECAFHGFEASLVTVCCDQDAAANATGAILHEIHSPIRTTSADKVADYEFRVGINADPSPNVTPSNFLLFRANVSCLRADICQYLVTLQTAHPEIADVLIVIIHTRLAEIDEQFGNSVPSDSRHSRRGADTVSLNQGPYYPDAFLGSERVHIEHYA